MNIQQLISSPALKIRRSAVAHFAVYGAGVLVVLLMLIEPIRPIFAKDSVLLSLFNGVQQPADTAKPTFRECDDAPEEGLASWYGKKFHGRKTANGEFYNMNDYTAAHRNHPFGTILRVTNLDNGKEVIVRVNDRGPFKRGRKLDLSFAAAQEIGLELHHVKIEKLVDVNDVEYIASSQIDSTIYEKEGHSARAYTSEQMVQTPNLRTAYEAWKNYADRGLKTSLRLVNIASEQEFEVGIIKTKARKGKPATTKIVSKVSKQPCYFTVNVHFRNQRELIAIR
jgi:rare lipoprotein A